MHFLRGVLCVILLLTDAALSYGIHSKDASTPFHVAHKARSHRYSRKHRATNDGALRFDPQPTNRRLAINSSGKIHCKVAGGVAPNVQWTMNGAPALPEGVTSSNGTLTVSMATRRHAGAYTCRAVDGDKAIEATIQLDVVAVDGALRFEPQPYNKKLELNSSGKIHCKVAGGVEPTVVWTMNGSEPLPEGVTSSNGTLTVAMATRRLAGAYTCRAVDGNKTIEATIQLDVVVFPRILSPSPGQRVHANEGSPVYLHCVATGDPRPTTHWDRNLTILNPMQEEVDVEDGVNASSARILLLTNGTILIRSAVSSDADRYGCTAGSAAGLTRQELELLVLPAGSVLPSESEGGVAGKAVVVSAAAAAAYMLLVLALMLYCRRRRLRRRRRGEKMELEMAEGREKLVEEGEEKKPANGTPAANGRLLPIDKDSGADNSEVSGISRASKKSGQYDHLTVPRNLLKDQIVLGRGEFGDVMQATIDMSQVKRLRAKDAPCGEPKVRPVLVKAITTKDENQLAEVRRQIELLTRARHANLARLVGLCNEASPHLVLIEHADWGDLKNFLIATRTPEETKEYQTRVGSSCKVATSTRSLPPLAPQHCAMLAAHLASAAACLAAKRLTHRDIAARNCTITSQLHLKLSFPALSRGPDSHEYYKMHDQVVPLRWLPSEAVLEGEYSTKSDAYMFAATIWEIYTKAELPFAKLNDNSVFERLKSNTLEWVPPKTMPEKLADLLKRCWNHSPTDRPQFTEICDEIHCILQAVTADCAIEKQGDSEEIE